MKGNSWFIVVLALLAALVFPSGAFAAVDAATIPTFSIQSVVKDASVTIYTYNFPANDTFDVLMNVIGTRGVNGIKVGSLNSGKGGSLSATYNIPDALKGDKQIAIRVQANSGSGYYAFNWFYNNTAGSNSGETPPGKGYTGYPTFSIQEVVRNQTVTIKVNNLPKNDSFSVRMGAMGTKAVNGYLVDSFDSGDGGSQTFTFEIPAQLQGSYQIAIRIESTSGSGYFAYNWFYNTTT